MPCHADTVRAADPDSRTKEQKHWVAIDRKLNPHAYPASDQLDFDPDYQTIFSVQDLERITSLPEHINLALPFLNSSEEIEVHRLFNKYMITEAVFLLVSFYWALIILFCAQVHS